MKKFVISYLLLIAFHLSLFSQNRPLTGKVTDNTGAPLPGVSVLVKGSKKGVSTNETGTFSITVPNPRSTLCIIILLR